ncbi:10612_t:CDS:2, partial [Racocetra fulgida]
GNMTFEDFVDYRPIVREPIIGSYHGRKVEEIISKEFAARVRHNVSETRTYKPNYYDPIFDFGEDHGTTHISVIDVNNMAVSFTSTVNQIWGARVLDSNTGVILNNEMNDFAVPGEPNIFGLWPSPYNFVDELKASDLGLSIIRSDPSCLEHNHTNLTPGKRPLSSTVPTIVENEDGELELVIGGSG